VTDHQHARILGAYIARLTPAALERITQTIQAREHAAQNLGMSSQLAAAREQHDTLAREIGHMPDHDRHVLDVILFDTMTDEEREQGAKA